MSGNKDQSSGSYLYVQSPSCRRGGVTDEHRHTLARSAKPHAHVNVWFKSVYIKSRATSSSSLHHSADTWITSPHIYLTGKTAAVFLFLQWSSWFCSPLCIYFPFCLLHTEHSVVHHHEDSPGPLRSPLCFICRWFSTQMKDNLDSRPSYMRSRVNQQASVTVNSVVKLCVVGVTRSLLLLTVFFSAAPAEDKEKAPGQYEGLCFNIHSDRWRFYCLTV